VTFGRGRVKEFLAARLMTAEAPLCASTASHHEQPVVVPQVMHFRQVPLRTMVN
jgi:hypothetical protein